jgi:hypothetical protein
MKKKENLDNIIPFLPPVINKNNLVEWNFIDLHLRKRFKAVKRETKFNEWEWRGRSGNSPDGFRFV